MENENEEMLLSRDGDEMLSDMLSSQYIPTEPRVKEYKEADIETKEFADISAIHQVEPQDDSLGVSCESLNTSRDTIHPSRRTSLSRSKRSIPNTSRSKPDSFQKIPSSMVSSKVSKKSHFEERLSEKVSFERNIEMNKSLQHRATVETSSKFHDFKDIFTNTRTLILYEQVVKLTELIGAFQKETKNLDSYFQGVVQSSEEFVELLKESKTHFDATATEINYNKMIKQNDMLLNNYENLTNYLLLNLQQMSQSSGKREIRSSAKKSKRMIRPPVECPEEDYQRVKPVIQISDQQERFSILLKLYFQKCSQSNMTIKALKARLQLSQCLISRSLPIQNYTQTLKASDRKSLPPRLDKKIQLSAQQRKKSAYSQNDIIESFKENLQNVEKWLSQSNLYRVDQSELIQISHCQEFKMKVVASFFTLSKTIHENFCNLPAILSDMIKPQAIQVAKECHRQCLQAISRLRRYITSKILNFSEESSLLEQLHQNQKFVTDLSNLEFNTIEAVLKSQ